MTAESGGERCFIDLHCHTRASFDSLATPAAVVRAAAARGLTHLLITDHDRIDGALEARAAAPDGLTVLVGEEIRTLDGDLIAAFIREPIPPGLSAAEAIAAVRVQGGLVGIPHPFDRFRGSLGRGEALAAIAPLVDWIEIHNARIVAGSGNDRAAAFAIDHGLPGVAVSDAHSVPEVGVAYTIVRGDPSTPDGLLAALESAEIVPGRASYVVRALTPAARLVQRLRGNRRIRPAVTRGSSGSGR
jgi:hypothetical protein